jgi:small subunit ribosomal protein S1
MSIIDYGVFVRVREGVEGLIPQNELTLGDNEDGTPKTLKIGDDVTAEIANIDSQDRRITLSMRVGGAAVEISQASSPKAEKRESRAPKKASAAGGAAEEAKAGSIGELIKQKLGLQLGLEKDKKDAEKKAEETE